MAKSLLLPWLVAALAVLSCDRPAPAPGRPDIIFVVIDTLRADHLSEYGYPLPTSGGLARFAAQSSRFSEVYATAPWTTPSTASILSGLVPARHRTKAGVGNVLGEEILTLAEALSATGWATAGFSANVNVSRKTRFDQGFETFLDYQGGVLGYPDISLLMTGVERWLAERRDQRPYFLYLQTMNTHGPYRVPPPFADRLLGRAPDRLFHYRRPPLTHIMAGGLEARSRVTPGYLASLSEQYDTAIRYTTDVLGRLLDMLEARGEYESALIVVTSDHGEELFDHGGFSHGYSLNEEVLRVPLYLKLPGQREGRVIRQRASLLDLYPTVLDLVGIPPPEGLDGVSLKPLLRPGAGAGAVERDLVFEVNQPRRCVGRALLAGPWKVIRTERGYEGVGEKVALYRLDEDPGETHDLAAEHPELVAELLARMDERFGAYARRAVGEGETVELDRETLKALGYL